MSKKVLSVTIDERILADWKKYTEECCINSSQLIEKLMKEYLEEKNATAPGKAKLGQKGGKDAVA